MPEGGNLQESDINHLVRELHLAADYARITHELKRDNQAREKWIDIYPKLSDDHPGLLGSVTSKAEAQVMRLACLYALLDKSEQIRLPHLEAALAFWQYCEDSARYIFGNKTGNKMADDIFNALLASETGLTRTDFSNLFKRNKNSSQIDSALKILINLGRITVITESTDGRPRKNAKKWEEMQTMSEISAKQERLVALLLTERTIEEACQKAKVNVTTYWRWMQDETFLAEYRKMRRGILENTVALLQSVTYQAIDLHRRSAFRLIIAT